MSDGVVSVSDATREQLSRADEHSAHNYSPLPVVIESGAGSWVKGIDGVDYLDVLAGYSALNFGHAHPTLVRVASEQLGRLTLTSRAFQHDRFASFCEDLSRLCRKEAVLPMNTGAEAVETALKLARKWGYDVKGVPPGRAEVITCAGNFHGRTISIVGFSSDPDAYTGFGPFPPGFASAEYGNADAFEAAITENTVAVLLEPIQGEAGVLVPPPGYLAAVRDICTRRGILMIADEIQSGLGRTGDTFACDHENVTPDVYVLGKALGGGLMPVSAVVADWPVMAVIGPGQHGSTFGGNPLACAVGSAVVDLLETGEYQQRSRELGAYLHSMLSQLPPDHVSEVRGRGLWAGVQLADGMPSARTICERLLARRVLAKDAHEGTIRIAPPLVIERDELTWAVEQLADALAE
ncbi:ornithine--oxo-acid aminotransferase [Rhodococcus sp. SC4]|uniref:ornithine--oxo-acid transaminase n=1 Tax=unclassified Rhodococcus (in: high G+C Gram-positive bacteria) TaxID=192944 RepID=UPI00076AA673|nr:MULTISPECIES: ornithine--oxo-acid transaminase [unclassified Rhodococcus (in: high G+C Gram-positive bacteria)]KXF55107.1 ornithine--oxo-acid aminotransferase [Rhodococcus sp. SC4]KXX56248.1 ornithine--oxo-acid transaminase [Rhodococcus sp. LB1]PBC59026.1 ornithine--oxo-acid transaminase [Rhodococcus sp. ACPA1]RZK83385.1 MAG: ornithine--oxo-acid transaminase [Rhodococcus sp. (in: high G+C Gram-positive bacteria)]